MHNLNKVIFNPFEHNLDKELFLPVVKNTVGYDCMIGYFNSSSFRAIAQSLLYYLQSDVKNWMRLIVSPNLSKEEDITTLVSLYEGEINHTESGLVRNFEYLSVDSTL